MNVLIAAPCQFAFPTGRLSKPESEYNDWRAYFEHIQQYHTMENKQSDLSQKSIRPRLNPEVAHQYLPAHTLFRHQI